MGKSVTLQTVARHAPLSMGFFRQEYWSGLPCPPEDLSDPGSEPTCPALQANSLLLSHQGREFKKQGYLLKHEDIKTYDGNEKLLKDFKAAEWQNQNL